MLIPLDWQRENANIDILFDETILMSVSENDALWNNLSKQELAQKNLEIINAAIKKYKSETSTAVLAKEIALAFLVILIVGVLIYFVIKLFRFIAIKISQQEGKILKGIKIRDYTLFNSHREVSILVQCKFILQMGGYYIDNLSGAAYHIWIFPLDRKLCNNFIWIYFKSIEKNWIRSMALFAKPFYHFCNCFSFPGMSCASSISFELKLKMRICDFPDFIRIGQIQLTR